MVSVGANDVAAAATFMSMPTVLPSSTFATAKLGAGVGAGAGTGAGAGACTGAGAATGSTGASGVRLQPAATIVVRARKSALQCNRIDDMGQSLGSQVASGRLVDAGVLPCDAGCGILVGALSV